jgi:hypothetical protein
MSTQARFVWQLALLPLAATLLLLPGRDMQARDGQALHLVQPRPDREQFLNYEQGRRAWEEATRANDPKKKAARYQCALDHLTIATEGPSHFPEATLALGLLHYHRDDVYHAEEAFTQLVGRPGSLGMVRGALRAEGLVYAGILALRRNHWTNAKSYFTAALTEDLAATVTSVSGKKKSAEQIAALKERAAKLRGVAQVGSALATYYQAVHPANPAPGTPQYEAAAAAARELQDLQPVLDANAAIWRFPEQLHARPKDLPFPVMPSARVDWTRTLDQTVPAGVSPATPADLANSIRNYTAGSLEMLRSRGARPAQLPGLDLAAPGATPVTQDRRNAAMALTRRLMWLQMNTDGVRPDYAGASATLRQLAPYSDIPGVSLMVRQHSVWIALEGTPDVNQARALTFGAGAADDPLIYNEIYSLAQMLLKAGNGAAAVTEWRKIVAGVPESGNAAVKAEQTRHRGILRPYAEANIAAWSLNSTGNAGDPAFWRNALAAYPIQPGREELRFFLALRWGAAAVQAQAPAAELAEAMKTAQDLAAGRSGGAAQQGRDHDLNLWYRYLAHLAHQNGSAATYATQLAGLSDYYAEHAAYRASQDYAGWVSGGANPANWPASIRTLMEQARAGTRSPVMRTAYERTIQDIDEFLAGRGLPGQAQQAADRVNEAWANAVRLTGDANTASRGRQWAQAVGLWEQASTAWTAARTAALGVDARLLSLSPEAQAVLKAAQDDAGGLAAQAAFKKAEALHYSDRSRASTALDEAERLAGSDPASQRVKALIAVARRAGDGKPAGLGADPGHWVYRAYTGGRIPPRSDASTIVRYSAPHSASVGQWLARIRSPRAEDRDRVTGEYPIDKLVKWFNRGYGGLIQVRNARGATRSPREHVRTGWTRETLLAFLEQNLRPTAGWLPRGTVQYGYLRGRFVKGRVRLSTAAFYLNNGRAIISAHCSNPLDVILVTPGSAGWPPMTPVAYSYKLQPPIIDTVPPNVAYRQPNATFEFAQYGFWDVPTHSAGYIAYPVCPGAFSLLLRGTMPPKLPVPPGVWIPPHCSPARITIGRVSTQGAREYPLRVELGTAESRKR